ncbi:MAG: prolyl oligopeptidase family serine peptidase [Acidimicrobiales bacterium]
MPELPFGTWPSPLSAQIVSSGGVGVAGPSVRGFEETAEVWWSELRPAEGGRTVLVRNGLDRIDAPFNARTRVHEYGGGAWWLGTHRPGQPGAVYFANWDDQRLYRFTTGPGGDPTPSPITPDPEISHGIRFADGSETPDGNFVICVMEDHYLSTMESNGGEAMNVIVAIPTDGSAATDPAQIRVLASGPDFVAAPRIAPDGGWLSWISWNHPNMPWDGTELHAAPLFDDARLGNSHRVAGGGRQAVHGANWVQNGDLVFSSDDNGWWNLHRWSPGTSKTRSVTSLTDGEIGGPQWQFGTQHWTELSDERIVVSLTRDGQDRLATVADDGSVWILEDFDCAAIAGLAPLDDEVVVVSASSSALASVQQVNTVTAETVTHRRSSDLGIDTAWFSQAEALSFPSGSGRTSHAFFYPPAGPSLVGSGSERPPLVVMGHGGPTSHSSPALSLKVQYWTSRGFAVVDVNYGGSSGFGTDYRRLLNGQWGVVDVEDVIAAATFLADAGRVDPTRMAIRGGSAGGFTVLAALEQSEIFAAGTSLYGVADLQALAEDTHKFESRYLDNMIGPWPEARDVYTARSPINHTEDLSSPLLVMQGSEDEVVPPSQSEAIVAAVAAKHIPHAYLVFEGEQHGFRQAPNVIRSLEAELWFYGYVFGFKPADDIEPLDMQPDAD